MDAPASVAGDNDGGGGGGGRRTSSSNRRRGSSWAKEEGNMTSQVLTRRRLLAFGGVAIVVGATVGLAATRGGRQGAQTATSAFAPMAGGLNPAAADPSSAAGGGERTGSGLSPTTTVTPVRVPGKANATGATTSTTAAAAAGGAGKAAPAQQQSNLEKLLDQIGGASKPAAAGDTEPAGLVGTGTAATAPAWALNTEDALLTMAAKAQEAGAGGARLFMNYVEVAGCTPEDGKDLARIVENTTCRLITLKPRFNYSIETPIQVERRVTIIGRPLGMPIIDGHNSTRIFDVASTGHLDVRFCQLIKGRFIEVIRLFEYHLRGPLAWVRPGGSISLFGCVVTVSFANAIRFVGFTPGPQVNVRIFGGGIVSEAGVVRAMDCFYYYIRPGIAFRELEFIGGEFLILGGSVFLTGCIFFNMSIFSNSLGAGGYIANLGGTVTVTGCIFTYTGAFVCTMGQGYLFFNGGGVMAVTGIIVATSLGMASYFGGGIGMFTGGGVSCITGIVYNALASLGFGVGLGFQAAVGGGISIRTGVIQSSHGAIAYGAGVGISTYCGTGVTVFNTLLISRSTALLSYYGTASYFYLGAGVATTANVIGFFVTGCGAGAFGGGDSAVLAGWMTRALHYYITTTAVSFLAGQGADLLVGCGGAVLAMNGYLGPTVPLRWNNPGLAAVYIAGNNVISFNKVRKTNVIFKIVGLKRGVFDYRNNIFIARNVGWRFINRTIPEDFLERHRKAALAMTLEENDEEPPHYTRDYNHLPIEEALKRARAARKLYPSMPAHFTDQRRMGRHLIVDVQQYFLNATANMRPAPTATATVVVAKPAAEEKEEQAGGLLQQAFGPGGEVNSTATANNPWFYFANHPALQAEGSRTDKIYMAADDLAGCSVCGVTSSESVATRANVDGPGTKGCVLRDSCEAEAEEEESVHTTLAGQPEFARMWVTDRGGALPNTTIATISLKATFTPGRTDGGSGEYTTVSEGQVAAALNATIHALGLPTRYHLKAERAVTSGSIDPMFSPEIPEYLREGSGAPARKLRRAMRAAARRRLLEAGEFEGQQECGRNELFVAYVVSDWKNVTDAIARVIRSSEAEAVLTELLQRRVEADAAEGRSPVAFADDDTESREAAWVLHDDEVGETRSEEGNEPPALAPVVCTLVAYRTASLHVPSTSKAGVSQVAPPLPMAYALPGMDGAVFAPPPGDLPSLLTGGDDDDDDDADLDPQTRAVLTASPSVLLVEPPSAAEQAQAQAVEAEHARRRARRRRRRRRRELGEAAPEEEEEQVTGLGELPPRAKEVLAGETYAVVLQGFAPGQLLTLRLVPEYGDDIPLLPLRSAPAAFSKRQQWDWTVPSTVAPGEYFLEVTSPRGKDGFAYSQAFTVLP